jgi:UDP-N-acetylglucosamine:LPS N-acetylglucosamine transferase
MKLCLVTSPGGHLFQLISLKKWWSQSSDRFWVSIRSPDSKHLLKKEKVYWAYGPESRSILNMIKNTFFAFKILRRERPDLVFSSGAGVTPPFIWVAWLMGIKTIHLEAYDFVNNLSLSGKLVIGFVDYFLVQHRSLRKSHNRAEYWGSIL